MQDGPRLLAAGRRSSTLIDVARQPVSASLSRRALWMFGTVGVMALAGCSGPTKQAPIEDGIGGGSSPTTAAAVPNYTVKPGDTLYGIARANNVDAETIKRLNTLTDPNQLRVGQVLRMSDGGAAPAPAPRPVTRIPPVKSADSEPRALPDAPAGAAPTSAAGPVTVPTPTTTPAPDAGAINWAWPTKGALIQTFSANTKGIDIVGNPGDPVNAAADGKVMYVGNGVRGLGNLVIVNHDSGFISVYGHNSTLLVKTGQQVKRGEKIAEVGQSDTSSPRLHFEVRRRGTPVDPLKYLPPQ